MKECLAHLISERTKSGSLVLNIVYIKNPKQKRNLLGYCNTYKKCRYKNSGFNFIQPGPNLATLTERLLRCKHNSEI